VARKNNASNKKQVVFSTDPDPEPEALPVAPDQPVNQARALPTLQQNHPVTVHRDRKKRGGKTVSVIRGVKSREAGKKALLKHLKSKLGSGGTIRGDEIEIQGEQREQIVVLLNELGYKAKVAGG
jgi:translation initiation factor 1